MLLPLKKSGKTEEATALIDEGLAKYPKDATLLVEKINVYLEGAKYPEALAYVNNLLDVERTTMALYSLKVWLTKKLATRTA
jgi:tetratricopeptide (TPR) repeat protein